MSNDGKYNSEAKEDSTPVAKEKNIALPTCSDKIES
jgi:hypothetical protein